MVKIENSQFMKKLNNCFSKKNYKINKKKWNSFGQYAHLHT